MKHVKKSLPALISGVLLVAALPMGALAAENPSPGYLDDCALPACTCPVATPSQVLFPVAAELNSEKEIDYLSVTLHETGNLQKEMEAMEDYCPADITALKLTTAKGEYLNYADFTYMRECLPNLTALDIEAADCIDDYNPTNPIEHRIPRKAFSGGNLRTVVLSRQVDSIGQSAFYCCPLTCDLVIPGNVKYVGICAFSDGFSETYKLAHKQLRSLTLEEGIEVLDAGVFMNRRFAGDLEIPASVTTMRGNGTYGGVFYECYCTGHISFAENSQLETIEFYTFSSNPKATFDSELNFPELKSVGQSAFGSVRELRPFTLPNSKRSVLQLSVI